MKKEYDFAKMKGKPNPYSKLLKEQADYTKWRRDNLYENLSLSELNRKAAEFARDNTTSVLLQKTGINIT